MSNTTRFTSGIAKSSVGKPITQDRPQAVSHVARKAGEKPRLRAVAIADTTELMNSDSTNGVMIPA